MVIAAVVLLIIDGFLFYAKKRAPSFFLSVAFDIITVLLIFEAFATVYFFLSAG